MSPIRTDGGFFSGNVINMGVGNAGDGVPYDCFSLFLRVIHNASSIVRISLVFPGKEGYNGATTFYEGECA